MHTATVVLPDSKVKIRCKITAIEADFIVINEVEEPILVDLKNDDIIPGLYKLLLKMRPREKQKVTLTPYEGYGEYYPDLRVECKAKDLPENLEIKLGNVILVHQDDNVIPAIIKEIFDDSVIVDFNHLYAGQNLDIYIELVEII